MKTTTTTTCKQTKNEPDCDEPTSSSFFFFTLLGGVGLKVQLSPLFLSFHTHGFDFLCKDTHRSQSQILETTGYDAAFAIPHFPGLVVPVPRNILMYPDSPLFVLFPPKNFPDVSEKQQHHQKKKGSRRSGKERADTNHPVPQEFRTFQNRLPEESDPYPTITTPWSRSVPHDSVNTPES